MFRHLLLSAVAVPLFTALSFCRAQNPPEKLNRSLQSAVAPDGSIDMNRLRSAVMSQIPADVLPDDGGAPWICTYPIPGGRADDIGPKAWGIKVTPVPESLATAHESLTDGNGLLVVRVTPGKPGHRAGLKAGMVLVSVDGQPLSDRVDLPNLDRPRQVVVLTEQGLRTATLPAVVRPLVPQGFGAVSSSSSSSSSSFGGENVSVSNVNGQVHIDATLPTADGPQRIELQGTAAEIDAQIDELPADLAQQLRDRVSY